MALPVADGALGGVRPSETSMAEASTAAATAGLCAVLDDDQRAGRPEEVGEVRMAEWMEGRGEGVALSCEALSCEARSMERMVASSASRRGSSWVRQLRKSERSVSSVPAPEVVVPPPPSSPAAAVLPLLMERRWLWRCEEEEWLRRREADPEPGVADKEEEERRWWRRLRCWAASRAASASIGRLARISSLAYMS